MKALLWREYRQHRMIIFACAGVVLMPYLLWLVAAVLLDPYEYAARTDWLHDLAASSVGALLLCAVSAAIIAGNLVAGERADRSSQFVGYLPINRASAMLVKLAVGMAVIAVLWLANYLVLRIANAYLGTSDMGVREMVDAAGALLCALIMALGVAWCLTTLLRSPALCAGGAILAALLLFVSLLIIGGRINPNDTGRILATWFAPLSTTIGLGSFLIGVAVYLRRIEP